MRRLLLFSLLFLIGTTFVFAQGETPVPPEPSTAWEFFALLSSAGLVTALLQLFRRINLLSLIPSWLRPILAGTVGIGTTALTDYLLRQFGVNIDLSAIASFFAAGGGGAALFSVGKELKLLNSSG